LVKSDQLSMSKKIYNLYDAKTALSSLVERAAAGEEIIIAKAGTPRAKLVPVRRTTRRRKPGGWERRVRIGKDFDAPLPAVLRDAFGEEG
jgi:prevent-host-death family protein